MTTGDPMCPNCGSYLFSPVGCAICSARDTGPLDFVKPMQFGRVELARLVVAAKAAMHTLLHFDADMKERTEAAEALATAIEHPWPPYPTEGSETP